jgi:hypothetical protein
MLLSSRVDFQCSRLLCSVVTFSRCLSLLRLVGCCQPRLDDIDIGVAVARRLTISLTARIAYRELHIVDCEPLAPA